MKDKVIVVEELGKSYLVGHRSSKREQYTALRDVIVREVRNFARKSFDFARGRQIVQGDEIEEFWALRNVSFEVEKGEVLGIIGRNGAGKSTLLKILSRITEPTEGRVVMRGRVGSLLEVGTGFHPELSGRENIYMNGAILGMTQREIRRKFDEIVSFAGVERFLDTPVKRYSSGMYVRLAFAVAAHLEPEILVVDEVLAVGDAEFQKKCLGKMSEVAGQGRTVLFVSHNMGAVRSLCSRAIAIADGSVIADAPVGDAVNVYLRSSAAKLTDISERSWRGAEMPGNESVQVQKFRVTKLDDSPTGEIGANEAFRLNVEYRQTDPIRGVRINIQLVTQLGEIAFTTSDHSARNESTSGAGVYTTTCEIPGKILNVGRYTFRLSIDVPGNTVVQNWLDVGSILVTGHHNGGTFYPDALWPGVVSPLCRWSIEPKVI
jgi:lipopolysaccharide transport system ATP-binding protein